MTDEPMDRFDARLVELMTGYADQAMTTYDPAAIARVARDGRPRWARRVWSAIRVRRDVQLMLLAATLVLLGYAATVMVGSIRDGPLDTTIVLGPAGPERRLYRVSGEPPFALRLENRSDVTWLPWGDFAEKDSWCNTVAGSSVPGSPCSVAPHSMLVLSPSFVIAGRHEIFFVQPGVDLQRGVRTVIDVVDAAS